MVIITSGVWCVQMVLMKSTLLETVMNIRSLLNGQRPLKILMATHFMSGPIWNYAVSSILIRNWLKNQLQRFGTKPMNCCKLMTSSPGIWLRILMFRLSAQLMIPLLIWSIINCWRKKRTKVASKRCLQCVQTNWFRLIAILLVNIWRPWVVSQELKFTTLPTLLRRFTKDSNSLPKWVVVYQIIHCSLIALRKPVKQNWMPSLIKGFRTNHWVRMKLINTWRCCWRIWWNWIRSLTGQCSSTSILIVIWIDQCLIRLGRIPAMMPLEPNLISWLILHIYLQRCRIVMTSQRRFSILWTIMTGCNSLPWWVVSKVVQFRNCNSVRDGGLMIPPKGWMISWGSLLKKACSLILWGC